MSIESLFDRLIPLEEDPEAFNSEVERIAQAIKQIESTGDYGATSKDGGLGAYQFTGTWDSWSSEFARANGIGNGPLPMNPENQDSVAKFKIGQLLSKGYEPKQIASIWNSGSPKWEGKVGRNKAGVRYDVPKYVNDKFWPTYQMLGMNQQAIRNDSGGVLDRLSSLLSPSEAQASEIPPEQLGQGQPKPFLDRLIPVEETKPSTKSFYDLLVPMEEGGEPQQQPFLNRLVPVEEQPPETQMPWSQVPGELGNLAKKGAAFSLADIFSNARMPEAESPDLMQPTQQRQALQPYIEEMLGARPVSEQPRSFLQQSVIGLGDAPMAASPTGLMDLARRTAGTGVGLLNALPAFGVGGMQSKQDTVSGAFKDAFDSAYDSVFKEGSFGAVGQGSAKTILGQYYDKLPQWMQSSADLAVEGAVDPINWYMVGIPALIRAGAKNIIPHLLYQKLNRTGTLPLSAPGRFNTAQHMADVNRLNAMEDAERNLPIPLTDMVQGSDEPFLLTDRLPSSVYTPGSAIDQMLQAQKATQAQAGRNVLEPFATERPPLPSQDIPPQAQQIMNDAATAPYPKVMPEARSVEDSLRRAASNAEEQFSMLRGGASAPMQPMPPSPQPLPFEPAPGIEMGQQRAGNLQNLIRDTLEARIGERSREVGVPPVTQGIEPAQDYVRRVGEVIEKNRTREWLGLKQTTKDLLSSEQGGIRLFDETERKYKELMKANPYYQHVQNMVGEVTPTKTNYTESFVHEVIDRYQKLKEVTPEAYKQIRTQSSVKDVMAFRARKLADELGEFSKYRTLFTDLLQVEDVIARGEVGIAKGKRPPVSNAMMVGGKNFMGPMQQGQARPIHWIYEIKHPGGITVEQAKKARPAILNSIETVVGPGAAKRALTAVRETWQKFTEEDILGQLIDRGNGGLLTEAQAKEIAREHGIYATHNVLHYVPKDLDTVPGLVGRYYSAGNQSVLKKAYGSLKQIQDPVDATLMKWSDVTDFANRNRIAYMATEEMMTSPNPAVREMIHPIAGSKKQFMEMYKAGLRPVNADWKHTFSPNEWKSISRYTKDGAQDFLVHRDVADILTSASGLSAPRFVKAMNAAFRAMATSSYVPFVLRNAARDAFMAYTTGPYGKNPAEFGRFLTDWAVGATEGAMHEFAGASPKMEDAIRSGMGMGFTATWKTPDQIAKSVFSKSMSDMTGKELAKATVIDTPGKLFQAIEKLSSSIELAPRYAVYRRALKKGMSPQDAAMLARESTIDFDRAGALLKVWNQFVPFLNARVQARVSLRNALFDPARRSDTAVKMANIGIAGGALAVLNHAIFGDLMYEIPDYVRRDNFVLVTGSTTDPKTGDVVPKYFKIAKGDIGTIGSNPIEFAIERAYRGDKATFGKIAADIVNSFSPLEVLGPEGEPAPSKVISGLLPPSVKSLFENVSNYNYYTGRKIEPSGMERMPKDLRYKENTPEVFKLISKLTSKVPGINEVVGSPLQLQNMARGLAAGYGGSGGSPKALMESLKEVFYSSKGGESRRNTTDAYYSMKQDYEHTRARAKQLVKDGERNAAVKMMESWNSNMPTWKKKIEKYGFKDEGGLRSFYFTNEKMNNVLASIFDDEEGIEEKLRGKRRR